MEERGTALSAHRNKRKNTTMNLIQLGAAAVMLAFAASATAQTAQFLAPSLSLGVVYDDNVFSAPADTQDDFILRVTPALEAGVVGPRSEFRLYHSFDAEWYQDHSHLDSTQVRRYTELDFGFDATERLNLGLFGTALSTDVAGETLPDVELELGRVGARHESVRPSVGYRFTQLTTGNAAFEHARHRLDDGERTDTDSLFIGMDHRTGVRDRWTAEVAMHRYDFSSGDRIDSNALLVGWVGAMTPRTTLTVKGGPRDTDGDVDAEILISSHYTTPTGEVTMNFARTQTVVVGEVGIVDSDSVWLTFSHAFTAQFRMRAVPAYGRYRRDEHSMDVLRLMLEGTYRFSPRIAAIGRYQWHSQDGSLAITGPFDVSRNVLFVGVTVAFAPHAAATPVEMRDRR
jgi:hypothetical protein